jgi:hypothetical protein
MPVVGLHQGKFRVAPKGAPDAGTVSDYSGRPIVDVSPRTITVVAPKTFPRPSDRPQRDAVTLKAPRSPGDDRAIRVVLSPGEDPGTRFQEKEFLEFLSGIR